MSIGTQFREAREAKKVTLSEAAAAIRTKIQQVEALETDHFERFASPVYARGFIKLYAEYLGLDPAPLLREYSERHAPPSRPPLVPPTVAAPRRRRTTVTEEGVVETTEIGPTPALASASVQPPVTEPEAGATPTVAAEPSAPAVSSAAADSATAPEVTPSSPRSPWALVAAAVVVVAAIAIALWLSNRPQRTPMPQPPPAPVGESVSPILELPPEPLLDPFADEGNRTRR